MVPEYLWRVCFLPFIWKERGQWLNLMAASTFTVGMTLIERRASVWSGLVRYGTVWSSWGIRRTRWHSSFMLLWHASLDMLLRTILFREQWTPLLPHLIRPWRLQFSLLVVVFCSLPFLLRCSLLCCVYRLFCTYSFLITRSCVQVPRGVCGTVPLPLFHNSLVLLAPLFILLPLIFFFFFLFFSFLLHPIPSSFFLFLHPHAIPSPSVSSLPLPPRHPLLTPP